MSDIRPTIDEVPVPAFPGDSGWDDFAAAAEVRNVSEAEGYGTTDLYSSAEEDLPLWLNQAHDPMRLFVVRAEGRVVARGVYETLSDPAVLFSWFTVQVLPPFRRRGIGTAILEHLDAIARAEHRSVQVTYAVSRSAPGDRLTSPTGLGSVPLHNPEVQFLLRRGFTLEQVERASRLELPVSGDTLTRLAQAAAAHAGPDYTVQLWTDQTPAPWHRDMALLHTRMSTDAPTAGLEEPEDIWTEARLVASENLSAAGPRTMLTAAVLHESTGRLAGFSQLSVPAEPDRAVGQEDTLVLREHRGHRLGMMLKVANLQYLALLHPGHPSVITFNAEENRHMLAVNETLGFTPMGYEGAWKRVTP